MGSCFRAWASSRPGQESGTMLTDSISSSGNPGPRRGPTNVMRRASIIWVSLPPTPALSRTSRSRCTHGDTKRGCSASGMARLRCSCPIQMGCASNCHGIRRACRRSTESGVPEQERELPNIFALQSHPAIVVIQRPVQKILQPRLRDYGPRKVHRTAGSGQLAFFDLPILDHRHLSLPPNYGGLHENQPLDP